MTYDFEKKLAYSQGIRKENDLENIKSLIPGVVKVTKTNITIDKTGIDYFAELRKGTIIKIDAKTREPGCSKYWIDKEPELAPEIWSVMPGGKYNIPYEKRKAGWTLSESNQADYIYCTFHFSDSEKIYLLPFQLYRIAFKKRYEKWIATKKYKTAIQDSKSWESQCLFVPVLIIIEAICKEMELYK
jgi:hypothetical protein